MLASHVETTKIRQPNSGIKGDGRQVVAKPASPRNVALETCSEVCRHRAWEQTRAAEYGFAAVEVVERVATAEAAATLHQALQQRLARHDRPRRHY